MTCGYRALADRIRQELVQIDRVVSRCSEAMALARVQDDPSFYVEAAALNLYGFYNGAERVFQMILRHVDGGKWKGERWHREVLDRVAQEREGIRPPVISGDFHDSLVEYLGFRHIARNIYGFDLRVPGVTELVEGLEPLWKRLRDEFTSFAEFLEKRSEGGRGKDKG